MAKSKIVMVVEYNGKNYYGFQLQANQPTIQAELEKAIQKLSREKSRVISASRTDTGVHAKGQLVSFRTDSSLPTKAFVGGLNHYLPKDVAVKAAYRVRESFNVRRDAISREYCYYILNRDTRSPINSDFACQVSSPLDTDAMDEACRSLLGEHDFASFVTSLEPRIKSTVRRVYKAETKREGALVSFNMVAGSFLPHQVRNTVGTLISVGLGKMTPDKFNEILEAKKPALAGPTAPACGLFLMKINYPQPLENYDENL